MLLVLSYWGGEGVLNIIASAAIGAAAAAESYYRTTSKYGDYGGGSGRYQTDGGTLISDSKMGASNGGSLYAYSGPFGRPGGALRRLGDSVGWGFNGKPYNYYLSDEDWLYNSPDGYLNQIPKLEKKESKSNEKLKDALNPDGTQEPKDSKQIQPNVIPPDPLQGWKDYWYEYDKNKKIQDMLDKVQEQELRHK